VRRALACLLMGATGAFLPPARSVAQARAQSPPQRRDYRPYVKLMCDCSRQVFRLVTRNGRATEGAVLETTRRTITMGSGTIVTPDGLVLTNHHVYEALVSPDTAINPDEGLIVRLTPLRIVVAEVNPTRPLAMPDEKYVAEPYGLYPERDMAVLKIVRDARTNQAIKRSDFAVTPLGNPYAIDDEGELTLIGYPGKGGETITLSRGLFQGFMLGGGARAEDGAIKSSAPIAGGNSGGAALYGGRLVGVPTRVSAKSEKGADFSYLYPVTWAAQPLAYAALRFGQSVPALDNGWVRDSNNTDLARDRLFAGARLFAAQSGQPVPGIQLVAHRKDRTYDQIAALYGELNTHRRSEEIHFALRSGRDTAALALELGLSLADVRQLDQLFRTAFVQMELKARRDTTEVAEELALSRAEAVRLNGTRPEALSADAQAMVKGEFFYYLTETEPDGFFLVALPRAQTVTISIRHQAFRDYSTTVTTTSGTFQKLGDLKIFSR